MFRNRIFMSKPSRVSRTRCCPILLYKMACPQFDVYDSFRFLVLTIQTRKTQTIRFFYTCYLCTGFYLKILHLGATKKMLPHLGKC